MLRNANRSLTAAHNRAILNASRERGAAAPCNQGNQRLPLNPPLPRIEDALGQRAKPTTTFISFLS